MQQTWDLNGNLIPLNLETGQIAWSVKGGGNRTMSGRSEQVNETLGIASTYACYNCCPNSVHDGWITPGNQTMSVGGLAGFEAVQQDINCYNQVLPSYPAGFVSWSSSNSSVASVSLLGQAEGLSAGETLIEANWYADHWFAGLNELCEYTQVSLIRSAHVDVTHLVQVTEVGFTGDHTITRWAPPGGVIDSPDGSTPTWKSTGNPDDLAAYTRGSNISMFAKLMISPAIPASDVRLRVKNGSTVIATKDVTISGTVANITNITTNAALESTVKKTTPTFNWEMSFDDGANWVPIGSSGPHAIYWTYATPLSPSFRNDNGDLFSPLYDLALQKATSYANGSSNLSTIIGNNNIGVDGDINYDPSNSIFNQHPLNAFSIPGGSQCSDLANLLRGLLRSLGIDGTTLYIWAGPDASTIRRYTRSSGGNNSSFRIIRGSHDSAEQNPHFKFHAVVSTNSTWYDPSYGLSYSNLVFDETAFNNTPQQISSSFWSNELLASYSCPH